MIRGIVLVIFMVMWSMNAGCVAGGAALNPSPRGGSTEVSSSGRDLDCAIDLDQGALRAGWVSVRFLVRPDQQRQGCSDLGLGGATIELLHEGTIIRTVETGPISYAAPPYFSHGFTLHPDYRDAGGRFTIRAFHGSWQSNEVEFVLPGE